MQLSEATKPSGHLKQIFCGIFVSIITAIWWHSELTSLLGDDVAKASFACLLRAGTGDCSTLWLAGLHQTNQFASLLFYGGMLVTFYYLPKHAKMLLIGIVTLVLVSSHLSHIKQEKLELDRKAVEQKREAINDVTKVVKDLQNITQNISELLNGPRFSETKYRQITSQMQVYHDNYVDRGVTKRRHIRVRTIHHIGKEANKWEQQYYLGINSELQIIYGTSPEQTEHNLKALYKSIRQIGIRKLAKKSGLSYQQISAIINGKSNPRNRTILKIYNCTKT